MTEHTFKPGDRAYHVVRREIITLEAYDNRHYPIGVVGRGIEQTSLFTADGKLDELQRHPHLLPLWHPDVPERCREAKPKRRVEVVRWMNVYEDGPAELAYRNHEDAARAVDKYSAIATAVELRGSYEVSE